MYLFEIQRKCPGKPNDENSGSISNRREAITPTPTEKSKLTEEVKKLEQANKLVSEGNYEAASKLFKELYEVSKETYGDEHVNTILVQHNLACCLSDLGDDDTALKHFEPVYKFRMKTLGKEHEATLRTNNNIASIYFDQKNFEEALARYKNIYAIQRKVYGVEHKSTLETMSKMSYIMSQMSD